MTLNLDKFELNSQFCLSFTRSDYWLWFFEESCWIFGKRNRSSIDIVKII